MGEEVGRKILERMCVCVCVGKVWEIDGSGEKFPIGRERPSPR